MTNGKGRVLLTGCPPAPVEGHRAALAAHGFAVELEADPAAALSRLASERFAVVVSWYPLDPGALGSLVGVLRSRGSLNASASLILLAEPSQLRAAASLVGRGVAKVLAIVEDPTVLAIVVEQMVHESLPMVERLPLRYPVTSVIGGVVHQWTTENVSGGGMLLEAGDPPPVGSSIRFTLELATGAVAGDAKVVRHVNSGREPVAGFGVRFLSFAGDGKARLLDHLRDAHAADAA